MKFCPRCGKKGIKGDFCSECYAETVHSMLEFKEIHIRICPLCMTYIHKNRQVRFNDLEVVVRKIAKENIKKRVNAEIKPILPDVQFKPGKRYEIEVEITLSPKEKYYIPAVIEMVQCKRCSRMGTKYYEGILQLRNPNKEAIAFIRDDISSQKEKGIFITDEKKAQKGIDFYITSQRYLQRLGHKLQRKFGGILKISPQLFTRNSQTSKDVYRINMLFELLPYNVGDAVKANRKIIRITSIGKHIAGINIKTGKRTSFSQKEEVEVLKIIKAEVVKTYPDIEILNPETYQPVKVEGSRKVNQGDRIEVIVDEGKFYLI